MEFNQCPGSMAMKINREFSKEKSKASINDVEIKIKPQLRQWPVQLKIVPETAPYFEGCHLLITADCVPFAYPNYHLDILKGKAVVIGCPKLDDVKFYIDKLSNMIILNKIKDVTVAYMEVPCCRGILMAVKEAIKKSGKEVNLEEIKIGLNGEKA